ncbi:MAG: efflux RND transporter permease subunit [Pseudomonadales bacterium]
MERCITWFVDNPVAANLLMLILLVGGTFSLISMHKEEFPSIEPGIIQITIPYLGAAPAEVERAVCIRVEEALEGLDGIERLTASAMEGICSVFVEVLADANLSTALNEVKGRIDAITTFPAETEKPVVSSMQFRGKSISVVLSGETDEATLKLMAESMRDDIAGLQGISQVSVNYARPWEISIEISEHVLRRYSLTMNDIASAIRRASLDLPGGSIKTSGGEVLIRSQGQAYQGFDFERIEILTRADGSKVTLGEIAVVKDAFQEGFLRAKFDGQRAVTITVWRVGDEDTITSANSVKAYVDQKSIEMPEGLNLDVWIDESVPLNRRIDALTKNAYAGLVLVLLILTTFLRFKVALWVSAGIPIAVMGAIWMFPAAGLSISSLTVLAFILVLGIVVDDAIVVGERIFAFESKVSSKREAAIQGTSEVVTPVVFGVLTTMAAFLPILIIEGRMGAFFSVIGWVVVICLIFSIIECMLILPAHLTHRKTEGYALERTEFVQSWIKFQTFFASGLQNIADKIYRPFLVKTLEWRWVTWAVGTGVLLMALALVFSGRVIFQFFPSVEGDRVYATLLMPEGINVALTERGAEQIEKAAKTLRQEMAQDLGTSLNESPILHVFASIGSNAARSNGPPSSTPGGSHLAEVVLDLAPIENRVGWTSSRIANRWRDLTGNVTDAVDLQFSADSFSAGDPISLQIRGKNVEELERAAFHLKQELRQFPGVLDLSDSFTAGKREIQLDIKPEAKALGLTLNDLARQVRQAFYGEEAQRIQRGTDDVRVMVRYPRSERESISNLENMLIRSPSGAEVPFSAVASVTYGNSYSAIMRENQQRVITVRGDIDRSVMAPEALMPAIEQVLCENQTRFSSLDRPCKNALFPGVRYRLGGEQLERSKATASLSKNVLLALLIIYALLAVPLKSYLQPLIIMSVIPFGAVGAIVGHYIMGWNLIFFSLLGIIALSGVVVNASLVLVDYINRQRSDGVALFEAVTNAGVVRFRPIILTSVTTFVGLIPLMTNTDPETFMFIPMAISLAFGVLFSTVITLFLVPSLYLMQNDFLKFIGAGDDQEFESKKDEPGRPLAVSPAKS